MFKQNLNHGVVQNIATGVYLTKLDLGLITIENAEVETTFPDGCGNDLLIISHELVIDSYGNNSFTQ